MNPIKEAAVVSDGKSATQMVIFVNSYLQVRNALYLVTRNYRERPVTVVVPGNPEVFKFIRLANENLFQSALDLIYFEPFNTDPQRVKARGLDKAYRVLADMAREKRYLKSVLKDNLSHLKRCEMYFLDRGPMQFYLASRLRKENRITYISSYNTAVAPEEQTLRSIGDAVRLAMFKLSYGSGISLGKLPHRADVFPFMSDSYLEKVFDRVISDDERDRMLKDFELSSIKVYDTGKYSVIFFFDDLKEYAESGEIFEEEMRKILDVLRKNFPENVIASKYHPGYKKGGDFIELGDVLPDFIPAECLYSDNISVYIGGCSAAMSNVKKGSVISILDLISFRDEQTREKLRELLIKTSLTEILYPSSLDDLAGILLSLPMKAKDGEKKSEEISGIN